MNLLNPYIIKTSPPPNIFIGQVGATLITSASGYVAQTNGVTLSDVQTFYTDGNNNVFIYVSVTHTLQRSFLNNNSLCRYVVVPSNVSYFSTSFSGFQNVSNLKFIYLIGQINISNNSFLNLGALRHLNFNNLQTVSGSILQANGLKTIYLPSLTTISSGSRLSAYNNTSNNLDRIYLPSLTSYFVAGIAYDHHFTNAKSGGNVYYNASMGVADRRAHAWIASPGAGYAIGDTIIINGLTYTGVAGSPSVDGEFTADTGSWISDRVNLVNAINSDTRTGTFGKVLAYTGGTYIINLENDTVGAGGNVALDVSGSTGTSSSGANFTGGNDVAKMLQYLRDFRSWTLIELSAPITVNPPTSLSYSNLTGTTVDLNFTIPTANANGTIGYEVWVEDSTPYRKMFEFTEITASGQTVNLADVVTDVGSLSGVKIKIRTIDGQINYSSFSNEITIT